ncbi:MAG: hypothetical protein K940chlam8_00679 [Chlamydiae bacterium]|nr:hypothetical protein [Chlamydiota bacterium]
MKEDQRKVYDLFAQVISLRVHNFEIQPDKGLVIDFAQTVKSKSKDEENAPWYFWFYTAIWQLESNDQILATSNDNNRSKMQNATSQLKDKKLLEVEVPSDKYDVKLMFEGNFVLHLKADDYRDCNIPLKIQKLD